MIVGVRDDYVAFAIEAQMLRPSQRRLAGIAAIAAQAGLTRAGHGPYLSFRAHTPQSVTAAFEDINLAPFPDGHSPRINQRRGLRVGPVCGRALGTVAGDRSDAAAGQ